MANAIKQTNDGFNSIYKGNFSIGINYIAYGETTSTGFWNTIPATGSSVGGIIYGYIPKGSDGPSIYEINSGQTQFITAINQIRESLDGPYITTSTFTTTRNITIPVSSTASTYPLEFNVTGITENINYVTLTLGILSGSNVQNLGIVLVAPDNTTYSLIKGSLDNPSSTPGEISVNISQFGGVQTLPLFQWNGIESGNFNSSSYNYGTSLTFDSPCPVGPFAANTNYNSMSTFLNLASGATNGTWSLYVQDFGGDESTLLYANLSITYGALFDLAECFNWAASNNNIVLINRDYPSVNLSGLQLLIDPWYLPSANTGAINPFLGGPFGVEINDLTNNHNNATISSVSLGSPDFNYWLLGGPFSFNTVTNIPSGNSAYTLSIWFKTSYLSQGLISFGTETSYDTNYLYIEGNGYVRNQWYGSDITSTGSSLSNNAWHNAVVTYDGTVATIYIDGVFNTDLTIGTPLSVSPTSNLRIGGSIPSYSIDNFNISASMGPVMIYNSSLSANDVLTNYNNIGISHGYVEAV